MNCLINSLNDTQEAPPNRTERRAAASPRAASCEPAGFTIEGAMDYSGFARSRVYELMGQGKLDARKEGRRTIILGDSLRAYLANMPRADIRVGTRKAA